MVHFKTMDVRWIWRYRVFYVAGFAIMSLQIFLAVIFFTLYDETDRNSSSETYVRNSILNQEIQPKEEAFRNSDSYMQRDNSANNVSDKKRYSSANSKFPRINTLGLSPVCNIAGKEPISAINRARTSYCKQLILNTTCLLQNGQLYPKTLPHSCPNEGLKSGKSLGCFRDNNMVRLLTGAYYNSSKLNSQTYCINKCLHAGFSYAGVEFADECFCGNEEPPLTSHLPDSSCNIKCPASPGQVCGGYFAANVFETGVSKFSAQIANDVASKDRSIDSSSPVRIVFLLTLNGRGIRQVHRLIKALFHRDHFFFIHIDARQNYLFNELLSLELRLSNVRLSRRRHSTIWGGASLLTMLLESMSELIQSSWDWDFLINLSESDFPIKSNNELVTFLTANRNRNFVKSHGRDVHHFIQKQGLDKTFVECDEHMWRIGNKVLPSGIVIDGGSDWIALSRSFINYIVTAQNDPLLEGLKVIFKHTLLPAESFFHTALRNSIFCDTYIDNNLHVTNWKRHLGCKCQYKHVVDWCGCSPNAFTIEDWPRIQSTEAKSLFFARKFDPTVNQQIINKVEEWINGRYTDEFESKRRYWYNVFHHTDKSPVSNDALISLCASLSRHTLHNLLIDDSLCSNVDFKQLMQVHSYYEEDTHKGILVNFDVTLRNNTSVQFESWFSITDSFLLFPSNNLSSRFISLSVNTDFDAKEKMARNYANAIGPLSEPVLIYQLTAGLPANNVTVVWLNPAYIIEDVQEISLDESLGIHHTKSNLKTPLLPGIWKLYVVYGTDVLAEVEFVVLPFESISGMSTTVKQTSTFHSGSNQSFKVEEEWNYLIQLIKSVKSENNIDAKELRKNCLKNSSFTGLRLQQRVDSLTLKSFKIEDFCITAESAYLKDESKCVREKIRQCKTSLWSSFSPDPKTHITNINKSTGRLNW